KLVENARISTTLCELLRTPANDGEGGCWRRERDSNPRYGFPYTHFPGVRLQPLGHPSCDCALSTVRRRILARPADDPASWGMLQSASPIIGRDEGASGRSPARNGALRELDVRGGARFRCIPRRGGCSAANASRPVSRVL